MNKTTKTFTVTLTSNDMHKVNADDVKSALYHGITDQYDVAFLSPDWEVEVTQGGEE